MHRNRTWLIGSSAEERIRNRTLPVEGGDGSTLSLDFTTGVLDPRLTFTRLSTATFINSSGLVQWADANMFTNSAWNDATATPSGWLAFGLSATATVAIAADPEARTIAVTTGAGNQPFLYVAPTVSQGLVYTASVEIVSVTHGSGGTVEEVQYNQVITAPYATSFNYYLNGSLISTPGSKVTQTGVLMLVYTAGSQSQIRLGFGNSARNNCSVTVKAPQHQPGDVRTRTSFFRRTAAEGAYYAPRFDYDPTSIGTPRGLLIEGSANNLMSYSEDFSNAAWTKSGTNGTMPLTGTAPDNNAASRLLEENTTSYAKHSLERSISISAGIHTFSVWLKEPSTNSRRYAHIQLADGQATAARYTIVVDLQTGTIAASGSVGAPTGTGHSITAYPGGWYRVTISMNHVSSPSYQVIVLGDSASLFGGNNQPFYSATTPYKGLLVWGAQLEAGSGASSYIPTGASTGNRAADNCYMDGTNFSSWYNSAEGSIYVEWTGGVYALNANGRSYTLLNSAQTNQIFEGSGSALNVYLNTFQAQIGTGIGSSGPSGKTAAAFKQDDFAVSFNGSAVLTDTSGSMPTAVDRLSIGSNYLNSLSFKFASITRIKYWPTRLPNAQLQSLTT